MHLSKPWLVIVNPKAGNGLVEKQWPKLEAKLLQFIPQANVKICKSIMDMDEVVADAISQGIRCIMAVGGDGSAHHTVNAIMRQTIVPSTDITFSLLPLGTGNDWIKSHNIPKKWEDWLTSFKQGNIHWQNVGEIHCQRNNTRKKNYFINVVGMAYDGFVVKYSEGKQSILPGKLYYLWLSLSCLFRYTTQKAILRFDNQEVKQLFYTINIGICKYSGGGMTFVPHAQADGDDFALTYVGHLSRLGVIFNSFRFYDGKIATFKKATLCKTKSIEIVENSNSPLVIEADGEYLGETPVSINLLPKALKFIGS